MKRCCKVVVGRGWRGGVREFIETGSENRGSESGDD